MRRTLKFKPWRIPPGLFAAVAMGVVTYCGAALAQQAGVPATAPAADAAAPLPGQKQTLWE